LIHPHHADTLYEVIRFTPDMLDVYLETIRGKVALIQEPGHPRTPNEISCHWCRAKGICPEYQAAMETEAKAAAEEAEDLGFTAILNRSEEERGEHVTRLFQLKQHIQDLLDQYVKLEEKTEGAVKGFTVRYKWDKKITSEVKALQIIRAQFGENAADQAFVFSLTSLQAYLAKQLGAKKAEENVRAALKPVIKYNQSKGWLAKKIT
jgi:hypothetical protein